MHPFVLPIIGLGSIAVIILDAAGSYASNKFEFRYTKLALGSFCIYGCVGALAAHDGSVGVGAIAGGLVAMVDATIGWAISWYIGPGRIPGASPRRITKIALLVTGYGALCGGIAATLVLMFVKRLP
jgi:hypothetical protein